MRTRLSSSLCSSLRGAQAGACCFLRLSGALPGRWSRRARTGADGVPDGAPGGQGNPQALRVGFTILELMISIGIFAMILTAIYAIWIGILRGTQAGLKVAAEVQRTRIALRTLEEAFTGAEYFMGNPKLYTFIADTSGDFADVELSARIPDTFLGAEQTKLLNQKVRRLHFFTQPGKNGTELVMTEVPLLAVVDRGYEPYTVTLARDVTFFQLAFFDDLKNEWLDAWKYTNKLPRLVQIGLGLGKTAGDARKPYELVYSLIALPAVGVGADIQRGRPGAPGAGQGTNGFPGGIPPGGFPPGGFPGGFPPNGGRPGGFPQQ